MKHEYLRVEPFEGKIAYQCIIWDGDLVKDIAECDDIHDLREWRYEKYPTSVRMSFDITGRA